MSVVPVCRTPAGRGLEPRGAGGLGLADRDVAAFRRAPPGLPGRQPVGARRIPSVRRRPAVRQPDGGVEGEPALPSRIGDDRRRVDRWLLDALHPGDDRDEDRDHPEDHQQGPDHVAVGPQAVAAAGGRRLLVGSRLVGRRHPEGVLGDARRWHRARRAHVPIVSRETRGTKRDSPMVGACRWRTRGEDEPSNDLHEQPLQPCPTTDIVGASRPQPRSRAGAGDRGRRHGGRSLGRAR